MNLYDLWLEKTGKVPLTEHQQKRQAYLTSTCAAALLGCDPFRWSAVDQDSEVIQLGHTMESPLVRWASIKTGHPIIRNQWRVKRDGGILAATHDALARDCDDVGYEAKTSGIIRGYVNSELWGEEGTDEIPEWYHAQVAWQMIVSLLNVVWVPALLGGRGRKLYCVTRNDDLCEVLEEKARRFWDDNVQKDIPPADVNPSIDLAKMIRRQSGKSIVLSADPVLHWRLLDERRKQKEAELRDAKEEADDAKAGVLAAMGDADTAVVQGLGTVRIQERAVREYVVKARNDRVVTWKADKQEEDGK